MVRRRAVHAAVEVSAKTIGVTPEALRDAIKSGQSVAEVATAHNVDPSTVVNALVTAGTARIDKAVANHHLDRRAGREVEGRAARAGAALRRLQAERGEGVSRRRVAVHYPRTASR